MWKLKRKRPEMNILPEVNRENVRHWDLFIQVHGVNSAKMSSFDGQTLTLLRCSKFDLCNKYWDPCHFVYISFCGCFKSENIEFQSNQMQIAGVKFRTVNFRLLKRPLIFIYSENFIIFYGPLVLLISFPVA